MIGDNINTSDMDSYEPPMTLCGTKLRAVHTGSEMLRSKGAPNPSSNPDTPWCCYCAKVSHNSWECWSTTAFICNCERCVTHEHDAIAMSLNLQGFDVPLMRPLHKPRNLLRYEKVAGSSLLSKLIRKAGIK